jgi:TolB-like protein/DNA-binding winged helix-turn-helix (wHTH) protein/Tfp pilus assembly protein PilF
VVRLHLQYHRDSVVITQSLRDNFSVTNVSRSKHLKTLALLRKRLLTYRSSCKPAVTLVAPIIQVEDVEIDLGKFEVRRQGRRIRLEKQPFDLLVLLLRNPGDLVARKEIAESLWGPDVFVETDRSINNAIRKIRLALRDDTERPRFIETVPGRGYRFIARVSFPSDSQPHSIPQPIVSPEGHSGTVAESAAHKVASRLSRTARRAAVLVSVVCLILVTGIVLNVGRTREWLGRGRPVTIRSLAVLPLENLSGDPAQDYFAEGMTDELITDLAQLNDLRVISRTSVMRFKGAKTPLPQIARELQVDAIVEGSVVHVDTRVRVSAQLLDATSDRHLWAQTYERDLSDVIGLQRDVAKAIAGEIKIKLSPNESARLETSRAISPLAHAAFLKSRYFTHNQRSPEGARKSVASSLEAVRIAPDWALAYSGLADSYIQAAFLGALPPKEAMPKAKVAARRALELDPDLSEAHVALGWILSNFDYEYSASEREFKRAIELSPSSSYAHQAYADLLNGVGRPHEAISEIKRARQLAPVSFYISRDVGRILYDARRYDEALEALNQAADLNPASGVVYNWMSWIYDKKGMAAQSVEMDLKNDTNRGASQEVLRQLREAYRVSGERGYLEKHIELIKADPYEQALYTARLGETEKALQLLRQACEDHSGWLDMLKVDPELDNVRSDPRFNELLRRINFSP